MANTPPPEAEKPLPGDEFKPGPAASTVVSLSQILLAPLDAIFKAQVHAARSFVNQILQLSYPPRNGNGGGPEDAPLPSEDLVANEPGDMYVQKFRFAGTDQQGNRVQQQVEIPILALVPITPLRVQEAQFSLRMTVSHVGRHRQMRKKERDAAAKPPPWYLVDQPISVRGVLAPRASSDDADAENRQQSSIDIQVRVGAAPTPVALEKLLTALSQNSTVVAPSKGSTGAGSGENP